MVGMQGEPLGGLSSLEARRRLHEQGPNALADNDRQGWWDLLREVLTEPMFVLLLASAGLYLMLGDWGEGLLLSGFAVLTVALVVVQGRRREHALQALRELAVPLVRVRRDGQWLQCPAFDVVKGDWVMLSEGDRVAADGVLRQAAGLRVDEALLTGESWPVDKWPVQGIRSESQATEQAPAHRVWAGTLVVAGHGVAEVSATGGRTRMGGIGQALSQIERTPTPLQLQVRRLVHGFGLLALVAMGLVVFWWGALQRDWVGGVLSALALGMGMLPEEFPMVLAVFLSMGAWRLSRLHVLARRPAAIEALGTTTLLCVDKTGTLTENRLRLVSAWPVERTGEGHDIASQQAANVVPKTHTDGLLLAAGLASRRAAVDPLDRAIVEAQGERPSPSDWTLIGDWPVQANRPMAARLWHTGDGSRWLVAKGSPEYVAAACVGGVQALKPQLETAAGLAAKGLRVLAVAHRQWSSSPAGCLSPGERVPPGGGVDEESAARTGNDAQGPLPEGPLQWLGLLAFEDPMRSTVPAAVQQARQAGIDVCLITGDHAQTALSIARQAGIDVEAGVMEGSAFEALDAEQRRQAIRTVRVFARVSPLTKLLLVQQAQAIGHVVAMTGDGVNDAPALKAAHIGVAMGRRGTDVAREASALVLMREDFSHLVAAIAMGRTVFDNLRKVSGYIVSIHVPLAGLAVLPLLLGWPPLMTPAHVVLTEMLIDPMCSLAFEAAPAQSTVMRRPPRPASQGLLDGPALVHALALGLLLLAALMALGFVARSLMPGGSAEQLRTLVMTGLLAGNLTLVALPLTHGWTRADLRGPAARVFGVAGSVAIGLWVLSLQWSALGGLLQLQPLPGDVLLGAAAGTVALLVGVDRWCCRRQT